MACNHVENINAHDSARVHNGNIYNMQQDNKDEECMRALSQTVPSHEKDAILERKGGLLDDPALEWILHHDHYIRWLNGDDGNILWIKGDAGKGKTMMLCGIIDNLASKSPGCFSYFFCQATNQSVNNATAVLRGLIYGLVRPDFSGRLEETVLSHVTKEFVLRGPSLFDSWQAVSQILTAILDDTKMRGTVLVVDALDECEDDYDRSRLLKFILQTSCNIPWVKWAVTSRKLLDIEDELCKTVSGKETMSVDLEMEETSVSRAVDVFIDKRLRRLRWWKSPDDEFQQKIRGELTEKANNTFLWAALVCRELEGTVKVLAHQVVKDFPQGLVPLYERMMRLVSRRTASEAELCKDILATVSTVYRPLSLVELASLVESLYDFREDVNSLKEMVQRCGSFLTLRSETVYIVHQSAKEFLEKQAQAEIMPYGIAKQQHRIFARSLKVLSMILKRNICGLEDPGSLVSASSRNHSSIKLVRYACIYWVDHFDASVRETALERDTERGDILIDGFLHTHLLHWLEALSLLDSMSKAVSSLRNLTSLLAKTHVRRLPSLVQDAHRFILSHRASIETAPLQIYASALVFSPVQSVVRRHFQTEAPTWITKNSMVEEEWDACIQVLEGHKSKVQAIVFSADNSSIASGSGDGSLRVWDAATGACVKTFHSEGHIIDSIIFSADRGLLCSGRGLRHNPYAVYIRLWDPEKDTFKTMADTNDCKAAKSTLSLDGRWLACPTDNHTIRIWDTASGICEQCLEPKYDIGPVAFSTDNKWLVSGSARCGTITVWNATNWERERTLDGKVQAISSLALSGDCRLLASADFWGTIILWEIATGIPKLSFRTHHRGNKIELALAGNILALSGDGSLLATDGGVKGQYWIWDTTTGKHLQTLNSNQRFPEASAFSADGHRFLSGSTTIEIWDTMNSAHAQVLPHHMEVVSCVTLSADLKWAASGSSDNTIRIWDMDTMNSAHAQVLPHHTEVVSCVTLSADLKWAASGSSDNTIRIWDMDTMSCTQNLAGHTDPIWSLLFLTDDRRLVSAGYKSELMVWDFKTGTHLETLSDHWSSVTCMILLPNGRNLISGSFDSTIKVWDLETNRCTHSLEGKDKVRPLALAADGQQLVSVDDKGNIKIWALDSWRCLRTINVGNTPLHGSNTTSVAISANGQLVAVVYGRSFTDVTLVIRNLKTGHSLFFDEFHVRVDGLVFDTEIDNRLNTNVGAFDIQTCATGREQARSCVMEMRRSGYGISCDKMWIIKDERRMLWIPEKHRPRVSAMIGSTLIIGCESGHVQRITFSTDDSHSRSISTTAPAKSRERSPAVSAPPSKRQKLHHA